MVRFRYFVLFTPSEGGFPWWRVFTWHRPKFGHVSLLQYDPQRHLWTMIEYARSGGIITPLLDIEVERTIAWIMENEIPCLQVDVGELEKNTGAIWAFYCIPFAKLVLGISDFRIWTPWQLFCALRRRGARFSFTGKQEYDNG